MIPTAKSTRIYKSWPIEQIGTPTAVFKGKSVRPFNPSETRVFAHTICPPSQTPRQMMGEKRCFSSSLRLAGSAAMSGCTNREWKSSYVGLVYS